jgi:hypothetical protein
MHQIKSRLAYPFLFLAVSSVVGFFVFIASARGSYGRLDDYTLVVDAANKSMFMREAYFFSGRVIPSLAVDFVYARATDVSHLVWLRLLGVTMLSVGAALIAYTSFSLLAKHSDKARFLLSLVPGLAVFALPVSTNAATWAILSLPLAGFPFAICGGYLIATSKQTNLHWRLPLAFVFLLISTFSYQHLVMLALLPTTFAMCSSWVHNRSYPFSKMALTVLGCGVSLSLNYAFLKIVESESTSRTFSSSISDSTKWFLVEFAPRSVNFFLNDTLINRYISTGILLLAFAVPIFVSRRFLLVSGTVLLSWFISAVVVIPTENWASYRLLFPSQVVLWSGVVFEWLLLAIYKEIRLKPLFIGVTSVALMAGLAVSGANAWRFFAQPNLVDWSSMNCELESRNPDDPINALVATDATEARTSIISYDEVGVIGSSVDWVLGNMYVLTPFADARIALDHPVPPVFPKWASIGQEGNWIGFPQNECGTNP